MATVAVFVDLGVVPVVVVLLRVGETSVEDGAEAVEAEAEDVEDFFRGLADRLAVTVGIAFEDVEIVLDDVVLLWEKGVAITGAVLIVFFCTRPLRV